MSQAIFSAVAPRLTPLQSKETGGQMAAAAAYWRVLKAVHKHVGSGASRQHFRDFVAAEFRAPTGTEADAKERLQLAGDYLTSSPASTSTR